MNFLPTLLSICSHLCFSNTTPIKPLFRYAPPTEGEDYTPILILYGTEYGFSAELAKKLEDEIQKLNISPKLYPRIVSMEVSVYILRVEIIIK